MEQAQAAVPTVQIQGPATWTQPASLGLELTADGTSPCQGPFARLRYAWSIAPQPTWINVPQEQLKNSRLLLAEYTLTADTTYTLSVVAYLVTAPHLNATASVTVTTSVQQLVANVAGGALWQVSASDPVVLNGTGSHDPDLPPLARQNFPLRYQWKCSVAVDALSVDATSSLPSAPTAPLAPTVPLSDPGGVINTGGGGPFRPPSPPGVPPSFPPLLELYLSLELILRLRRLPFVCASTSPSSVPAHTVPSFPSHAL